MTTGDPRSDGPAEPVGAVVLEPDGATWVARLRGEVDAAVVRTFGQTRPGGGAGTGDGPGDDPVVTRVDAAAVTFIDSSGLTLVLRWATRAREHGRTLELRSAPAALLDLLRISGTTPLFALTD